MEAGFRWQVIRQCDGESRSWAISLPREARLLREASRRDGGGTAWTDQGARPTLRLGRGGYWPPGSGWMDTGGRLVIVGLGGGCPGHELDAVPFCPTRLRDFSSRSVWTCAFSHQRSIHYLGIAFRLGWPGASDRRDNSVGSFRGGGGGEEIMYLLCPRWFPRLSGRAGVVGQPIVVWGVGYLEWEHGLKGRRL